MPGTRKLGRPTDHRRAMLRGLVTYLLESGKVETTVTRAKEVRAMAEKMITVAKTNTLHSRRQVLAYVTKEDVVKKLFDEIAPKYQDVNGGYTRIIKTRRGDAAEMAIIELVEPKAEEKKPAKKTASKAAKKTTSTKKAAPKAEEKAEEVKEEVAAEATEAVEEAAEVVEEAPAAAEEVVEEAAEAAEEVAEEATEAAEAAEEAVEAAAEETAE